MVGKKNQTLMYYLTDFGESKALGPLISTDY